MVSLAARLKRNSVKPLSLSLVSETASTSASAPLAASPHSLYSSKTTFGSSSSSTGTFHSSIYSSGSTTLREQTSLTGSTSKLPSPRFHKALDESEESLWRGSPVFDASYWHAKGGIDLVRERHAELYGTVEALAISCVSGEPDWLWNCLALGWPAAQAVEIEYDVCNAESDPAAQRWLRIVQDKTLFPLARIYRLTTHWSGCTEIFEHLLAEPFGNGFCERLALLDSLPAHLQDSRSERRFLVYRLLFLVGVTFDMGAMAKTNEGTLAMYMYIVYLFKTDILAPAFVEFVDARPQSMQRVLDAINENAHRLPYSQMRVGTSSAALQSTLRVLRFEMRRMVDGRHTVPFCAAHFPMLESLVVAHSPDFKSGRDTPTNLGVLFSIPWQNLVELQLPFMTDQLVCVLREKCPALQYLHVRPEHRYERWTAYSQGFSPSGLSKLACQWQTLRQLVVRFAFCQAPPAEQEQHSRPVPPLCRPSFSSSRIGTSLSLDILSSPAQKFQLPGVQLCETFAIYPRNTSLRVLRVPYLRMPFSAALKMLTETPQLRILEFASLIRDPEQQSYGLKSTLRRRISAAIDPLFSMCFADSEVVYRLQEMGHPLSNMILHEACTTRYISTSWIQIVNTFESLESVVFVATKNDDIATAGRVKQFCLGNNASFAVEISDQTRRHQTCANFAESWERTGKMVWKD
ncbi:hypothetical protein LPJ57_002986 [Coemansia sp. RSA 486]|nr:hypothetical protein LPJ57_002986 [Coemansia sp. RSA 486]KAJ2235104.1 hypothetical protein IWW45_002883 [Coemansia sp. RSA 485]